MPPTADRPIAILYEHPDWFRPLFAELDRRRTPYVLLHADTHRFDATERPPYSLVFNRMSPSAWRRGRGAAIPATARYLAALERRGVRVINGRDAFAIETSKVAQLELFTRLGLPFPRACAIRHPAEAPGAARDLRFPVLVKPNVGGSGAGIRRFDTPEALARASRDGAFELGLDGTALVQEYLPAADGRIVRVEVLGGQYLYGIRIYAEGDQFNLCPADVCRTLDGAELERTACPVDAPANGIRVEGYDPPPAQRLEVERVMEAAGIEIGGVEYLVDARDGGIRYYDVNALSNFVADATRVVGFDPVPRLADYLEREAA